MPVVLLRAGQTSRSCRAVAVRELCTWQTLPAFWSSEWFYMNEHTTVSGDSFVSWMALVACVLRVDQLHWLVLILTSIVGRFPSVLASICS